MEKNNIFATKKEASQSFYENEPKNVEFVTIGKLNLILDQRLRDKSYYQKLPKTKFADNEKLYFGSGNDSNIVNDGTNLTIECDTGDIIYNTHDDVIWLKDGTAFCYLYGYPNLIFYNPNAGGNVTFRIENSTSHVNFLAGAVEFCRIGSTGELFLAETSTPTAITNYGAIYTKNDNKLYFQDGAGAEHEVAFV